VGAISDTVGNKQMIGGDTGVKLCLSGELWVFRLGPISGKTRKIEKFGKRPDFEGDFKDPFVLSPGVGKSSKEIIS
jgi:hypothetical protein